MDQVILDYLKTQRVCVLAVEMLDGSPHAATVHFANTEDPLAFFFETHREYRKSEALLGRPASRASLVIGSDEAAMKTFQLDGIVRLLNQDEEETFHSIYLGKFPNKENKSADPRSVFFTFIPKWWRFTDWTRPEGKRIVTSDSY